VILVQRRCKQCGRVLDEVHEAPTTEAGWSQWVQVSLCQRHGEGAGYGDIRRWQERQRRAGKPADRVRTHTWICWAELRPAVEKAQRTGKTQSLLM
jgi:hypothetical protein